jgi:hypothetical protein
LDCRPSRTPRDAAPLTVPSLWPRTREDAPPDLA